MLGPHVSGSGLDLGFGFASMPRGHHNNDKGSGLDKEAAAIRMTCLDFIGDYHCDRWLGAWDEGDGVRVSVAVAIRRV